MSLRALSTRASWRDQRAAPAAALEQPEPAGGGPPAAAGAELEKSQGALTDAIPTEVLGPYTAIVAIIVANASTTNKYEALRWWTYVISLVFIIVYQLAAYLRKPKATRPRKWPFVETLGALIAFAAWGLAMPGSPLTLRVTGSNFAIASAIIAIGGAAVLGLLSLPLNSKSSKAT